MVRTVVDDGWPPCVCCDHSHQEKVIGRTAVPAPGVPQATVAVAETWVESIPMTGANQCSVGLSPVTVTLVGDWDSTGGAVPTSGSLAATSADAGANMSPQLPWAQSCATASAAAAAATRRRAPPGADAPGAAGGAGEA